MQIRIIIIHNTTYALLCCTNTLNFAQLSSRLLTFVIVVGAHASLLLALQGQMGAAPEAASEPLIVDLIEPAPVETPPQPQTSRPLELRPSRKPAAPRVAQPHPRPLQPPAPAAAVSETAADEREPAASPNPVSAAAGPEVAAEPAPQPVPVADEPQPVAAIATAPRFDAAYLTNPAPEYPRRSRRAGEAGRVVLRVLVTPEGSAGEVRLRESSGFEQLDEAAIAAVRRWRFVAARQGDTAVAAWVVVPLRFDLDR